MSRAPKQGSAPPGLALGDGFSLPPDAVTQTIGILAVKGAGKTHLASVLVEEMVGAGLQVVVVDPVGVWWGLRVGADGKSPGLPVVILGGDHGDVALEVGAGALVAEFVVESRRPVILDLSRFRKGDLLRFMADFAETLYERNHAALHLVIDEADVVAPQRAQKGATTERLLGAVEDLVRRGRNRGLGVTLVTQRPAVVHKNVLTQIGTLFTLRMASPQDRGAINAWVKAHGAPEEREAMMASLASLPTGTAWVWSPEWLGAFRRVEIRRRHTFDSSKTPDVQPGAAAPAPALAPVLPALAGASGASQASRSPAGLDALRDRMAQIGGGEAEDPAALKRRIAALEEELRDERARARPAFSVEHLEDARLLLGDLDNLDARIADLRLSLGVLLGSAPSPVSAPLKKRRPQREAQPGPPQIKAGGRIMLARLGQFRGRGLTRVELGTLAGISAGTGTFSEYLSVLRRARLVRDGGERLFITEAGLTQAPAVELRDARSVCILWSNRLKAGARRMLEAVLAAPAGLNRAELAAAAGISSSTGTFSEYLSVLRRTGLVVVGQRVRQGPAFDVLAEGGPKG